MEKKSNSTYCILLTILLSLYLNGLISSGTHLARGEGDRLPLQNEDLYVLADYWEVRNVKNFTQDEGRMGEKLNL